MKNLLKLFSLAAFVFLISSCGKDELPINIESSMEDIIDGLAINENLQYRTRCSISGSSKACSGQAVTYTYNSDIPNASVTWSSTNGISIISGQGSNTATFIFNSGFSTGFISAVGEGSEICSETIKVTCSMPSNCVCPNPVIDDCVCVSGGHPHWRFQVEGISSADQIEWSINHGTVHGSNNSSYVMIEPNSGSIHGFTVYCKVTRTCSDGSTKERTAYYTNYYGNDCETGITGYVDSCGFEGDGGIH